MSRGEEHATAQRVAPPPPVGQWIWAIEPQLWPAASQVNASTRALSAWRFSCLHVPVPLPVQRTVQVCGALGQCSVASRQVLNPEHVTSQSLPSAHRRVSPLHASAPSQAITWELSQASWLPWDKAALPPAGQPHPADVDAGHADTLAFVQQLLQSEQSTDSAPVTPPARTFMLAHSCPPAPLHTTSTDATGDSANTSMPTHDP